VSVIPCARDDRLRGPIERFAELLKVEAHTLGDHGPDEQTTVRRGGAMMSASEMTAIRRV